MIWKILPPASQKIQLPKPIISIKIYNKNIKYLNLIIVVWNNQELDNIVLHLRYLKIKKYKLNKLNNIRINKLRIYYICRMVIKIW